jgi:hypothetical protein
MSKEITMVAEQKQSGIITDWQGYAYNGLREIVDHIKATELEDRELDLDETMRLALFIWNGYETDLALLTAERLAEILQIEEDSFAGQFDTEAEFAEEMAIEFGLIDSEAIRNVVVDWEGTYRYSFQFDYHNYEARFIDHDESVYSRYFWRSY